MPPPEVLERWRKERITNAGPDELREEAEKARCMDYPQLAVMLDAAADAWEKLQNDYNGLTDIADGFYHTVIETVAENEKLEKRLETAVAHIDEVDGRLFDSHGMVIDLRERLEAAGWMRDHYKAEGDAFHALNECLRRRLGVVERRLVEVEHDGDWDGLEGYVQTTMNSDAALAGKE
jgi:hypothetical protein